ncbi:MAG: hypothetical protein A2138_08580 [Deltaproteobacteria bacterium RBG_16_71_12]|nr:MAG: hypothetical protein A2138_08580 [Deltaproteobacteria bacterium RBG_16_71_12]
MNLTLSVDEEIVERARDAARQQGTSLNALIRQYLESLAGRRTGAELARELARQWKQHSGRSGKTRARREDAYAGRVR